MRWWRLTRAEATRIARDHVERQGLPWREPVRTSRTLLGGWRVATNSRCRGGNIYMSITRRGEVIGGNGVTPR